LWETKYYAVSI